MLPNLIAPSLLCPAKTPEDFLKQLKETPDYSLNCLYLGFPSRDYLAHYKFLDVILNSSLFISRLEKVLKISGCVITFAPMFLDSSFHQMWNPAERYIKEIEKVLELRLSIPIMPVARSQSSGVNPAYYILNVFSLLDSWKNLATLYFSGDVLKQTAAIAVGPEILGSEDPGVISPPASFHSMYIQATKSSEASDGYDAEVVAADFIMRSLCPEKGIFYNFINTADVVDPFAVAARDLGRLYKVSGTYLSKTEEYLKTNYV